MKRDTDEDTTRRDFLKTGAAVGAGAAAAALLPGVAGAAESATVEPVSKSEKKGYQVSQHVLDYYRAARI
jgi:anaerobic selenocysteine-containing dehydrogenase